MVISTKQKGDTALGSAIQYYLCNGYEVCLPIGDKRDYDFIVEKDNKLLKVQVKYAGLYPGKKKCKVSLRITGGNQSYTYAKKYNDDAFDILFAYTAKGQRYAIPWSKIVARSEITVEDSKYLRYIV